MGGREISFWDREIRGSDRLTANQFLSVRQSPRGRRTLDWCPRCIVFHHQLRTSGEENNLNEGHPKPLRSDVCDNGRGLCALARLRCRQIRLAAHRHEQHLFGDGIFHTRHETLATEAERRGR